MADSKSPREANRYCLIKREMTLDLQEEGSESAHTGNSTGSVDSVSSAGVVGGRSGRSRSASARGAVGGADGGAVPKVSKSDLCGEQSKTHPGVP